MLAAGLLVLAGVGGAQAQAPIRVAVSAPEIRALAGSWDVVAQATGRRCRIQLNGAQPGRDDLVAGIQPPCRVAIPALTPVLRWGLGKDGRILLLGADGRDVLGFSGQRQPDGSMRFTAQDGGTTIVLEPVGQRYEAQKRAATVVDAVNAVKGAASSAPVDPQLSALAGRYMVARDPKQPGCTVTLGLEATTLEKARKASLDASCSDAGLKVFDPAGWRVEGDRLFLVARKGHSIGFSKTRDGHFFKDPPQGKPLLMVRSSG